VVQLLALQVDFRSPEMGGEALGEVKRARPSDIMLEEAVHLGAKSRIRLGLRIGVLEFEHEWHQGLGDETAAEQAEAAALVRA
jgi:hypothetical protein